ncbi:MAG: WD40 repeat domain-containing protein, partial [Thermomicrobiales bacterium]
MRRIGFTVVCCVAISANLSAQEAPPLPKGAVARVGVHRMRVPGNIRDSAFTVDGHSFVVVHEPTDEQKENVTIFDVASGLARRRLPISYTYSIAVAGESSRMAVWANEGIQLWDMKTEKLVRKWKVPMGANSESAIAISNDGTRVAVIGTMRRQPVILRLDVDSDEPLPALYPETYTLNSIQYSPDGKKLFSISIGRSVSDGKKNTNHPGAIIAWDAKTGEKLAQRRHDQYPVVLSADGTKIARTLEAKEVEVRDFDPKSDESIRIPIPGNCVFHFMP